MTPLLTGVFASQISGHLDTFSPTGSYDALATYTVPSGGVSTITFAGLPTGGQYTHLQIRGILRGTGSVADFNTTTLTFNSDTAANYSVHGLQGNGSSAAAYGTANTSNIDCGTLTGNSNTANAFGVTVIDILDYASTSKYKTVRSLTGQDSNNTYGIVQFLSGSWRNLNAVNSITLKASSGTPNFNQYSEFSLYGVKG
jgi:hypothetical protein